MRAIEISKQDYLYRYVQIKWLAYYAILKSFYIKYAKVKVEHL